MIKSHAGGKKMARKYISFVGFLWAPEMEEPKVNAQGRIDGLKYKYIDGKDGLSIYLAIVDPKEGIGHLVADCLPNWVEHTLVLLDQNENPVYDPENFNPNPVTQLVSGI